MASVLVVADDLTGANACGAGFARAGLRSVTVGLGRRWDAIAEFHSRYDVIVATTESRHAAPRDAAEAVRAAVRAGWPVELLSARIDTTLRGNVGVATEALLATARELSGRRVVGLCLPGHPEAGRQTVEGTQLLHGVRLEDTELAQDVRSPVYSSSVPAVLRHGTSLTTAVIPVSVVTGTEDGLVAAVRAAVSDGVDVVVGDSLTPEHLDRVARAAVRVSDAEDVVWAGVDPGPGSVALARALGLEPTRATGPLLAVSGSATQLTCEQLHRLIAARPVHVVRPTGGPVPDVDATVAAVSEAVGVAAVGDIVLLASVLTPEDVCRLDEAEAAELPRALGRITRRVLQESAVDGLYTTGGDITAAVLEEIGGRGIEVEDEVVALAVAGEVVGGQWAGLPIVTKGGLIGDADTAIACLDQLAGSAARRARWVRSAIPREPLYQHL